MDTSGRSSPLFTPSPSLPSPPAPTSFFLALPTRATEPSWEGSTGTPAPQEAQPEVPAEAPKNLEAPELQGPLLQEPQPTRAVTAAAPPVAALALPMPVPERMDTPAEDPDPTFRPALSKLVAMMEADSKAIPEVESRGVHQAEAQAAPVEEAPVAPMEEAQATPELGSEPGLSRGIKRRLSWCEPDLAVPARWSHKRARWEFAVGGMCKESDGRAFKVRDDGTGLCQCGSCKDFRAKQPQSNWRPAAVGNGVERSNSKKSNKFVGIRRMEPIVYVDDNGRSLRNLRYPDGSAFYQRDMQISAITGKLEEVGKEAQEGVLQVQAPQMVNFVGVQPQTGQSAPGAQPAAPQQMQAQAMGFGMGFQSKTAMQPDMVLASTADSQMQRTWNLTEASAQVQEQVTAPQQAMSMANQAKVFAVSGGLGRAVDQQFFLLDWQFQYWLDLLYPLGFQYPQSLLEFQQQMDVNSRRIEARKAALNQANSSNTNWA